MLINTITLDFWNTLFDSSNGVERNNYRLKALKQSIGEIGKDIDDKTFSEVLSASWQHFSKIWIEEQRTPTTFESIEFFWKYLQLPYSKVLMDSVTYSFGISVLEYPPKLVDGVEKAIKKLAMKYDLGIVSDTGFSPGVVLKELLYNFGILKYFKAFSFSDETGVSKPHPKAFQTILDNLLCSPENSLHIGDIEQTDIFGAKKLGMQAIRFMGDKDGIMSKNNSITTLADFEVFSWEEAMEIIDKYY